MGNTTTSNLTDTIETVIEEARFTEQFSDVMAGLVWKITKKLHDGSTVNIPRWGTVSADALAEGVDMTNAKTMSDSTVTITPAEVGAKIILTRKLQRDNNEDVNRAAGKLLGEAMSMKRDQDLLSQLDDATNSLGAGGTLTLGQTAAGRAILEGNPVSSGGPVKGPKVIVHHPYVTLDIIDTLTPLAPIAATAGTGTGPSGSMMDDVLRNYSPGRLFGMPYVEDGNIDTTTTANSAKGGIFKTGKGGSIILATAKEWGVATQPDESLRADELVVVGEYGVGEYDADWIVELANDATLPA